jgi:hypothetical protein
LARSISICASASPPNVSSLIYLNSLGCVCAKVESGCKP